jgi:hypothetical protein
LNIAQFQILETYLAEFRLCSGVLSSRCCP